MRSFLLVGCLLLFAVCFPGTVWSQEASLVDEVLGTEVEEEFSNLNKLIMLTEKEGKLGLLRNWNTKHLRESFDETKEKRLEVEMEKMLARGLPKEHALRLAEFQVKSRDRKSPFLHQLDQALGRFSSSFGSPGVEGGAWNYSFRRQGIELHSRKTLETFSVRMVESGGIELELLDGNNDCDFKIRFFCKSGLLYLHQNKDRIQLSVIQEGKAETYMAKDYRSLIKKHPAPVNQHLLKLLENIGLELSLSLANAEVKNAALEFLEANAKDEMQVQSLLAAFVSDSLSARDEAAEELTKGYYKWQPLIKRFESDFDFDDIAKTRMKKIVATAPGTDVQDFVNSLDLLNNQRSLLDLLREADKGESDPVLDRLREVTGKSFGYDIDQWTKLIDPEPLAGNTEPAKN